CQQEGYWPTF
nr:immunoglobulin light chain junction region [Macaca mulatta]